MYHMLISVLTTCTCTCPQTKRLYVKLLECTIKSLTGDKYFFPQGDFVDRGYFSLETFTRLLTLKAK